MKNKFFKYALMILIFLLCLNVSLADSENNFYADLLITINDRGDVVISGLTNHPNITGSYYGLTSKQGKYWVFNLSGDYFSSALFKVSLPDGVVINYIKSSAPVSIGYDDSPFVKGILKDKFLEILIQYHFEELKSDNNFYLFFVFLGLVIFSIGSYLLYFFKTKKKDNLHVKFSLNDRQKKILLFLEKKEGVSQSFLEKEFGWPKSSLSRNIDSLVRKGLVIKLNKGNSNVIVLNKQK
jgi:uncharacterized membrane protein